MKREAQIFKALADETRLRIIVLLLEGELCVCEIIAALDLPQSTVSRHLAYLRNSGWLTDRRQGNWMYYRLSTAPHALVASLQPTLEQALSCDPGATGDRARLRAFQQQQEQTSC